MFRLFKSTERKLYELGYKQTKWDKHGFRYERNVGNYNYIHIVDFVTKLRTDDILQSYDKKDDHVVGLTLKEMKLFSRRIREWARSAEGMFR